MAGLEVLFASAAPAITCAQDALVCFLHWEVVTHGYYALGTGDQVRPGAGSGSGWEGVRGLLPKPIGLKAWSKAPVLSSLPSSEPGVHDPTGIVPKSSAGGRSDVLSLLSPKPLQHGWHGIETRFSTA